MCASSSHQIQDPHVSACPSASGSSEGGRPTSTPSPSQSIFIISSNAMAVVQFSSSAYVQLQTLTNGHSDTVNTLCFSSDGVHLASGGDDQAVIIWNALKGKLLYRILFENAVDCVLWHPKHPETLIIGLASGFLLQMHGFSLVRVQLVLVDHDIISDRL